MDIRLEKEAALIETVLFLESEPQDEAALARATGLGREVVEKALELLQETYREQVHGLEPVRSGGGWILAPKAELWSVLKERYGRKSESRMSRAALETLSIIAYSQPVTRAEIEGIRGVSADGMIRFLLERGFIRECGKKDAPGKPTQYGTTRDFLKYFRLGSIADLPRLGELERERFGLDEEEAEAGQPVAETSELPPAAAAESGQAFAGPPGQADAETPAGAPAPAGASVAAAEDGSDD